MLNFRQYSNVTQVEIPEFVRIKTGSLASSFPRMTSLKHVNINSKHLNNVSYCFNNCWNLISSPMNGKSIVNMSYTYQHCHNLVGTPVCGDTVINMSRAYYCCTRLTGPAVCGNNVTNMCAAYGSSGITGNPVCGPNVIDMSSTYYECARLTGPPVCGNNVINMIGTQCCVLDLKPPYIVGPSVLYADSAQKGGSSPSICEIEDGRFPIISMTTTYSNLYGNAYIYSSVVESAQNCFGYRNANNMLNIYVPANSTSLTTFLNTTNSIVENSCEWINDITNNRYYNTQYNIYIYSVENVAAAREANGD